jgi:Holliday junction resolvase
MTSRNKGAAAEREVALLLHQALQDVIEKPTRNLEQTRGGGHDLNGLPGVALEVKRVEKLALAKWWRQTVEQASRVNAVPVLAYRQNRQPWTFAVGWELLDSERTYEEGYFLTDLKGFAAVYRKFVVQMGGVVNSPATTARDF